MMINDILESKKITKYRLAKDSHVPYATLNDILSGKTKLAKCSAETVFRIASALDISMEELIAPYLEKRSSFELFKSNVCHRVKELGDIGFLIETLEKDDIRAYYDKKWYPECFYLLAMLDYISRVNNVAICKEYNDLRNKRLQAVIYPSSILSMAAVSGSDEPKREAISEAIPEFMRFNIVENEVRNVN